MKNRSKKYLQSTLSEKQFQSILKIRALLNIVYKDIRRNVFGQLFPLAPTTLNLLVNDICNSHCRTCLIWQRKRDYELSPNELELILQDSLFRNIRYIGVSGGEPSLRSDLQEIYRVLVQKHPPIAGTGIITNAIRKDEVISSILDSYEICRMAHVPFNIMISLDGIGEIHDHVRGRKGNFESAVAVIRYFRDKTDIPISIGCTISKDNVWHVDEVLDFCQRERIYGRFRIAEYINRLYNNDQKNKIRNFSELESYHLGLFFSKIEKTYETSPMIKRTYRSIRRMLLENAKRLIGCPWQNSAITLDCRGQLLYCSPRSPVLGNCLNESAQKLYRANIKIRKNIINNDCCLCIHDYHADETIREWWSNKINRFWQWNLSLNKSITKANRNPKISCSKKSRHAPPIIMIVGWYGTETAGDKAILGEIIHLLTKNSPTSRIILASLYPYVSLWTLKELGYSGIEIVPTFSLKFRQYAQTADEIIMGGGPLMHLEELGFVLKAFLLAKKNGHKTRIMGCGIGPLDRADKYQKAVKQILSLSDIIELRDSASVKWAEMKTGREDIVNSGDPAVGFVKRWMKQHPVLGKKPLLNLYLRDWTSEYQGALTKKEFDKRKAHFEQQLAQMIRELCTQLNIRPRLLPMHHFCVGGDDRDFNRRFARTYLSDFGPIVERAPFSLQEILASMQEGTFSLCMRFHSVLFANTLSVPFLAIDYTGSGKIYDYLSDQKRLDRIISLKNVADGKWRFILRLVNEAV